VDVWRDSNGTYVFMNLAQVTPGHMVGWGSLRRMSREEVAIEGYDYVVASLSEFPGRNGGLKHRRLKFQPGEFASLGPDRIHVVLTSPGTLVLFRPESPEPAGVQVSLPVSPEEFLGLLDTALARRITAAT
jgi:hypothetical protein